MFVFRHPVAVCAMIATPVVALAFACGGSEASPEAAEFGKLYQPCFHGDRCDPGLTCLPRAVEADGANLGTDGGQCVCLGGECKSEM